MSTYINIHRTKTTLFSSPRHLMAQTIEFYGPALPFVSKRSYMLLWKIILLSLVLIALFVTLFILIRNFQKNKNSTTVRLLSLPPERFLTELFLVLSKKYPHAVAWGNTALLQTWWVHKEIITHYQKTIEGVMPKEQLIVDLRAWMNKHGV